MEEFGENPGSQHAVTLCRASNEFFGLLMTFAGVQVDRVNQDVRVRREPPFNDRRDLPALP